MKTRRKPAPLTSTGDYSASITRRDASPPSTRVEPKFETAAASGIQTVRAYTPPQNELWYIEALHMLTDHSILPQETALTIECVQLRKVTNAKVAGSPQDIQHCRWLAAHFDVDPVF